MKFTPPRPLNKDHILMRQVFSISLSKDLIEPFWQMRRDSGCSASALVNEMIRHCLKDVKDDGPRCVHGLSLEYYCGDCHKEDSETESK